MLLKKIGIILLTISTIAYGLDDKQPLQKQLSPFEQAFAKTLADHRLADTARSFLAQRIIARANKCEQMSSSSSSCAAPSFPLVTAFGKIFLEYFDTSDTTGLERAFNQFCADVSPHLPSPNTEMSDAKEASFEDIENWPIEKLEAEGTDTPLVTVPLAFIVAGLRLINNFEKIDKLQSEKALAQECLQSIIKTETLHFNTLWTEAKLKSQIQQPYANEDDIAHMKKELARRTEYNENLLKNLTGKKSNSDN